MGTLRLSKVWTLFGTSANHTKLEMPLSVTLRGYSADFQTTAEVNYCCVLIVELQNVFHFL